MKRPSRDECGETTPTPSGARPSALDSRPAIDVSAALIFRAGRLLITRRHADAHLGSLWEFPGGKRESNETFEQCLTRELCEELAIKVRVGKLFKEITHDYPDKRVRLKFYLCELTEGEPKAVDCAAVKWIAKSELGDYEFPAADALLLGRIRRTRHLWQEG